MTHRGIPLLLALAATLALATPVAGQPTLRDAWLAQPSPPDAPGWAVMQHKDDADEQQRRGERLVAELPPLVETLRQQGRIARASGLVAWRRALEAYLAQPQLARTPGRADLAHLVAHPRENPALDTLASYGHCARPAWVEVWHPVGVARVPYRTGMTLSEALTAAGHVLGAEARPGRLGDHALWITPLGLVHRHGIAAWNAHRVEVLPGSRVLVPLAMETLGADWVDQAMPRFLASRLPGDACRLLSPTAESTSEE